jgi:hypothetical protein
LFPGVANPIRLDFSDTLALVILTAVGIFSHVFRIQFPWNGFPGRVPSARTSTDNRLWNFLSANVCSQQIWCARNRAFTKLL